MESVRAGTRIVFDGDGWGNDVAIKIVDSVKANLENFLSSEGYNPMFYTLNGIVDGDISQRASAFRGCRSEAIGYIKNRVSPRQEPILVDDGGCFVYGFPVLSVVIRDAEGANKDLHQKVARLLHDFGVEVVGGYHGQPPAPGTIIYALKRDPDLEGEPYLQVDNKIPIWNPVDVMS